MFDRFIYRKKPFLKDTPLNYLGNFLITFGFLPYLLVYLMLLGYIGSDSMGVLLHLMEAFSVMGSVGLILFLFSFIDFFPSDKTIFKQALYYFILGTLYYLAELGIVLLIGDYGSESTLSLYELLPTNYLFSILSFILIYGFLFYTPSKIKNKKGLIGYRFLAILPLAYLIGSPILTALDSDSVISLHPLVAILLSGQDFIPELVGLFYILYLFILKKHREKHQSYQLFLSPERDQFNHNLAFCLCLLVVGLLDLILRYTIDEAWRNILGIGDTVWGLLLIPLMLFYKHDNGPRNKVKDFINDWYYTALFFGFAIAYFILLACAI